MTTIVFATWRATVTAAIAGVERSWNLLPRLAAVEERPVPLQPEDRPRVARDGKGCDERDGDPVGPVVAEERHEKPLYPRRWSAATAGR